MQPIYDNLEVLYKTPKDNDKNSTSVKENIRVISLSSTRAFWKLGISRISAAGVCREDTSLSMRRRISAPST
jgi:hypothetical protein